MSWIEFWDADSSIYVNDTHKRVHYRLIADELIALLPGDDARVLDVGCGEALSAGLVAAHCRDLVLCEAAPNVRARLAERFAAIATIRVASPEQAAAMADGSFDLIVVNSVIQYLTRDELGVQLGHWRRLLARGGSLVLGDVLPPHLNPVTDATALLRFAWAHGFLMQAGIGLFKTLVSDYARKRAQLGLLRFEEADLLRFLADHGFSAQRRARNIGHNQARMTFVATPG